MARFMVLAETTDILDYIQKSLRGHVVFGAMTDRQALNLLKKHQVDLILVASNLNNSDGFSFLRAVKANPSLNHMRVVFFCETRSRDTYANEIVRAAGRALGVYRHIVLDATAPLEFKHAVEECLPDSYWRTSDSAAALELLSPGHTDDR